MKKKRKKSNKLALCVVVALFLCFSGYQICLADSSCVTCHTDEDMIIDNLAKIKEKKSALTSGSG